jgi:hypothetical protein
MCIKDKINDRLQHAIIRSDMEIAMPDPQNTLPNQMPHAERRGIGFGLFIFFAGCALLAERVGWLPASTDWLLPAILIAWGLSELYQKLTAR